MTKQKKRDLFSELKQGVEEIQQYKNTKKITLRTHKVVKQPHLKISATLIRHTREHLHMSRTVFAHKLRVSPRTLVVIPYGSENILTSCHLNEIMILYK